MKLGTFVLISTAAAAAAFSLYVVYTDDSLKEEIKTQVKDMVDSTKYSVNLISHRDNKEEMSPSEPTTQAQTDWIEKQWQVVDESRAGVR